jgi:benzoyl-CoA reductase/2-hydroxyglutaryl-CoA dehydratase subunit BcrC/BadD/HgdB
LDGLDLEGVEEMKYLMETMRIKMCRVIKERIFMNATDEAAGDYERNRNIALREALETARDFRISENDYRKLIMIYSQIKDQHIKELFSLLYKDSSTSVMNILNENASSWAKFKEKNLTIQKILVCRKITKLISSSCKE